MDALKNIKWTTSDKGVMATLPDGTSYTWNIPSNLGVCRGHTYFSIPLEVDGKKRTERVYWKDIQWA